MGTGVLSTVTVFCGSFTLQTAMKYYYNDLFALHQSPLPAVSIREGDELCFRLDDLVIVGTPHPSKHWFNGKVIT
jgi:hypothetical protein